VAVRPILQYPAPQLKERSEPVSIDDPTLASLVQDMVDTMQASPGVALAAPQIGILQQVIVVDVSRKKGETGHGLVVLLNPRIIHQEGPKTIREGCLSVPDYTGHVIRYEHTIVEGLTSEGHSITLAAQGFEALALQHEVDHLQGCLFLDRIASLSTDLFRRKAR
jgi:peptide deformylase